MDSILWPELQNKQILLGVTGGIAAYKAAELCRLIVQAGAKVRVIMTASAQEFVTTTTFAALSQNPVSTELFAPLTPGQIGHIELVEKIDLMVVAPATANILAKFAHGIADDLLSTVYLACAKPVLVAPAMNVHMWSHAATQANVAMLKTRQVNFVGPASGEMACGHVGVGRMAPPEEILQAIGACLTPSALAGKKILINAGPTHEAIDPVRFIGNRSSGKMGFALAAEAAAQGAQVTLISGPTSLTTPLSVERLDIKTAQQMFEQVHKHSADKDAIILAAAVADYQPVAAAQAKLKKENLGKQTSIELEQTTDILSTIGHQNSRPLLVGFAAETASGDELARLALQKLKNKNCDLLVANDVSTSNSGFESDQNSVDIFNKHGLLLHVEQTSKREVARQILAQVCAALKAR